MRRNMKLNKLLIVLSVAFFAACQPPANTNKANNSHANANASPAVQNLAVVERPQKIKDMMAARGEQDQAAPTLKIVEPAANSTIGSSTVKVKLQLYGDLKGNKLPQGQKRGM